MFTIVVFAFSWMDLLALPRREQLMSHLKVYCWLLVESGGRNLVFHYSLKFSLSFHLNLQFLVSPLVRGSGLSFRLAKRP